MTNRGVRAIVVALIAALGCCGAASAQTSTLKTSQARKLARTLAAKQVRGRDVVSFHITKAKRSGPNTVAFAYDDRTADNVYCTAVIVVTRKVGASKTTTSARFRGQRCKGIPSDVLAVESATRNAQRALRSTTAETNQSLDALETSLRSCRKLKVPNSRRTAVSAIVDIATVEALVAPNDAALNDFVTALGGIQTSRSQLTSGIAGWTDELAAIHSLPSISDPCATLKTWASNNWAADQSPIDLAAYKAVDSRTATDERAIARTAKFLAVSGVFPRTAVAFTPKGLLLRLAPKVGTTGGKSKLARL
jgi:hypothetical protein